MRAARRLFVVVAACASAWSFGLATSASAAGAYRLVVDAIPDSLRMAADLGGADGAERLWSGPELESGALRLRDLLAAAGDAGATVRLSLAGGAGSEPGTASLRIVRSEPASGTAAVEPVFHVAGDAPAPRLVSSARAAYERAAGGSAAVDRVASGLSAARDVLIEAGYYSAEVGLDSLAAGPAGIRAHVRLVAGHPAAVEAVELQGGASTRPRAAARLAGLQAGRPITPAVLREAQGRLRASGLFSVVHEPRLAPGHAPGAALVVIPVEEIAASRFEGALGVGQEGGVTGLVDLQLGNIAGTGRSAGLRWLGPGAGRAEYAARFREPALLGRPIDATLALDAQVAESLFTQTRWSAALGMRTAAGARASLSVLRTGSVYSGLARGSSATWSLAGGLELDRLRPLLNPISGFRVAGSAEGGRRIERRPGMPDLSRGLFRYDVSIEAARGLGSGRALSAAVRGAATQLGGGAFPAEELRYAGGAQGLRGHRDRAFGGSRVASASLEHRWITDDRGGRLYLFADAARHDLDAPIALGSVPIGAGTGADAASLARTVLSPGFEFGYGAGVRTRMASGLVGLELGLVPGEPLRRAAIHVRYASTW